MTVVELYTVFTNCNQLSAEQVRQALDALLRTGHNGKADCADGLIASTAASTSCERVMTFDMGAAKHADMTLVP